MPYRPHISYSILFFIYFSLFHFGCSAESFSNETTCEDTGCSDGLVCTMGQCIPRACVGALSFRDPELEQVLRHAVGVEEGDLLYSHLAELTALDTSMGFRRAEPGVVDLEGIECVTNLETLTMNNNQIVDLSPLAALESLRDLSLVSTPVSDLTPLAHLQRLESLDLSNDLSSDGPRDLSPIGELSNLRELRIAYGRFDDLEVLSTLGTLETLDASANDIGEVGPLAEMTSLRELRLENNRVIDINAISELTSIETLILSDNDVSDIGPLARNDGLGTGDRVVLSGNPVDCLAMFQASSLLLLLERGVDVLVDCLPCLDNPTGIECRCWLDPGRDECYCHWNALECLCEQQPEHPDCFCYFYPDNPTCE